jgi:methionyl aminopeptidase
MYNRVKTESEIQAMRASGKILASVLHLLQQKVEPGMATQVLDDIARAELKAAGATAPALGHEGFPAAICISVNNEVVHGIPGPRLLEAGDIVGLDLMVGYNGMITDAAITVPVGEVAPKVQRLLTTTQEALNEGIFVVRAGTRIGDISNVIEKRLKRDRLGIIEELAGHGVGHEVHEDPIILNYGPAGCGPKLEAGMTVAIEPMATLGSRHIYVADDGWTVITRDGSWGAHFEHTVLVTETGSEILTKL